MTHAEFSQLLDRFGQGLCSPDEQQRLEHWLDSMPEGQAPFGSAAEKEQLKMALLTAIHQKTRLVPTRPLTVVRGEPTRSVNWWPNRRMGQLAVAASVLLVLSLGIYGYLTNQVSSSASATMALSKIDLAPGGNRATLTLADGSTILLTDARNGTLAKQGSTAIRKTRTGEVVYEAPGRAGGALAGNTTNTITIPNGGQYRLVLADGTAVWLNAASSLTYPVAFTGHSRTVDLTGEAYFEVAPNAKMPFHVKTATQNITVLGTHFNVNAYADEPAVKTTLLEGSVQVSQPGSSQRLEPGQQAITTAFGGTIRVQTVDAEDAVAWKNGLFRFSQADVKTVMRQLSRWYDVDVVYEGTLPDRAFSGEIYRNVKAAQVLEMLSYSTIHFRVETGSVNGRIRKKIIVMP